jgi:hypothetical protein
MKTGTGVLDDAFIERLLLLSAEHVRVLSDVRKMRVRAALLAENLRLARTPVPHTAPVFVALERRQNSIFRNPRRFLMSVIVGPLTVATAAIGLISGYALLGGSHGTATATISGTAAITEQRAGIFGTQWQLPRNAANHAATTIGVGDLIVASSPITITFGDGSTSVAESGARFIVLDNGFALQSGAVNSQITKRAPEQSRFVVESASGSVTVKGTEFRVEVGPSANMTVTTFEGIVSARNDISEVDVQTGELVQLRRGSRPATKLQIPRLSLLTRDQKTLLTNVPDIDFNARIIPDGKLIAIDASGREYARFVADARGVIASRLTLQTQGRIRLRFIQEDASGSRRSDVSDQLEAEFDPRAFTLRVTQAKRTGNSIMVSGTTSPDSALTINGTPVKLKSDGAFMHVLTATASQSELVIISTDSLGNATRVIQVLDQ